MTINNCVVCCIEVLCTGHEDRFIPCLVKWLWYFLEAVQTNLIVMGIIVIFVKEVGEGGNYFMEEFKGGSLYNVEAGKSVWEGVGGMGAADTVVEGYD